VLVGLGQPNPGIETQTTTKHSGTYAVLLTNKAVAAFGGAVIPGLVNTGSSYLAGSGLGFKGEPYTYQPTGYNFFYIYNPQTGDTAFTEVILTKWNAGTNMRDTIAIGAALLTAAASYTQGSVNINWIQATAPDSILLFFGSSKLASPPANSALYVDDVSLTLVNGIQTLNSDGTFSSVYPNPAVNTLTFSVSDENAKYAKVYDLTGRMITTIELVGRITKADISSFESGMYIYVITDSNGRKMSTSKFNVAK
jgi:hypothetical protein